MESRKKSGPSFLKLNSALLSEVDYVNAIKSTIAETASEYESDEEVDEVLLWEMIKLKIRDVSMKYSKVKMKKMRNGEANFESALAALEKQWKQGVNNKGVLEEQIRCKKNILENIIQYKTKGAIIRSKARWYNEGEINSKYFLNLENRRCKRKTITQIKMRNGSYATNDPDILTEYNSFYSRLYASKKKPTETSCSDNLFFGQEHPSLNDIDKQKCEGLLSEKECLEALKTMEPSKLPRMDGLLAEFYKVYWKDVSPFLILCLNKSHQKGGLALTQRRGII